MSDTFPLVERTIAAFRRAYGHDPAILAFAPGRVNLIGDHTDYNDGFALPCALQFGTVVAASPLEESGIIARAADLDMAEDRFRIDAPIETAAQGEWRNHVRGIAAGLPAFGLPVRGAKLAFSGDVPQGNGLSSSASLGVALGLALTAVAGAQAPDKHVLARVAQWSEHHYVGCACGLLDQIASAFGEQGSALLLDCRSLSAKPVAFPADAAIVIVPSGVARGLVDSAYNERRAQCRQAAEYFGVGSLRDLDLAMLEAGEAGCNATVYRRARHVVTENARTLSSAEAMARGDLAELGQAMRQSHASLRDDFEVSVPAVDALVDSLNAAIGEDGGARMTGGGFGGCVVAVVAADRLSAVDRAIANHWQRAGLPAQAHFRGIPSAGARLLRG
ncbi:MAG: galactokinase [Blastomonas fulva]|uniref:galactokinase n=1 Tax=Blastomonas fulva TaxID=1550728 RepID=UPI0024E1B10D|nr:galactokinase [Blastomonas fulva]MDK2755777.1 galactokinase [Blastomonas fulva]